MSCIRKEQLKLKLGRYSRYPRANIDLNMEFIYPVRIQTAFPRMSKNI